jgi:SAM-dependent methyltransferase
VQEQVCKQNLEAERAWHNQKFYIDSGHWTSHSPFASRERHWFANEVEKIRFYGYLSRYICNKPFYGRAKILIAPLGYGYESKYLQGLYSELHGLDISDTALSQCPANIIIKKGDVLQSGYEDESFDIVICPLFLHHISKIGFRPFIEEYHRILRRGGVLAIQEPSVLFVPSRCAAFMRLFWGNVTGLVDDERPIYPPKLNNTLNEVGFSRIVSRGLSFNHVRFPFFVQATALLLDWPWRVIFPFKLFANGVGWYCEKPKN